MGAGVASFSSNDAHWHVQRYRHHRHLKPPYPPQQHTRGSKRLRRLSIINRNEGEWDERRGRREYPFRVESLYGMITCGSLRHLTELTLLGTRTVGSESMRKVWKHILFLLAGGCPELLHLTMDDYWSTATQERLNDLSKQQKSHARWHL